MNSSKIEEAFRKVDRINFVRHEDKEIANQDRPLPIGYSQTISQPYTVRKMLEWLDPKTGDKILDVGSGSGWTTALLSNIVGDSGSIYAVEKVPELVQFGKNNCNKLHINNAHFYTAGKKLGLPDHAPFDRILVSAAADTLPDTLLGQLKTGGKLVVPVRNSILEITKLENNNLDSTAHAGFMFVPLVQES